MKRLLLLALAGVLSGCLIIAPEPTPDPDPVTPLRVLEATFRTNFSANGQPAICSNLTTTVSYSFHYQGELESWTSYFRGVTLNQIKGERTFTPDGPEVNPYETNGYEVAYNLGPNFAPYSTDETGLGAKAIVPVPVPQPVKIGASKLYLVLEGEDGDAQPYVSPEIPVIENCP